MESILTSIKKLLGIAEDYSQFDVDIIIHINSVFFILKQLGVGPAKGFAIHSDEETWIDFLGESEDWESVKTYTYLKVKLLFDPPSSQSAADAIDRTAKEYEWRFTVHSETEV